MLKFCKYCRTEQLPENFGVALTLNGKSYRRLKCRSCKQADQNRRRQATYAWITEYKQSLSCTRCGFADFRALEFHHLDPQEKEFSIADFISRGASLARIRREIGKCAVLCANCHRIEHYNGM